MARIKEKWQGLSKKKRLIIIIVPIVVILGIAGGVSLTLKYFGENPSACGNCHIMQPYVKSYYDSIFIDSVHAKAEPKVMCKDCHSVTLVRQTKELIDFVTGNYETPLKQRVQEQNLCANCHTQKGIIALVSSKLEFTENPRLSYHLTVGDNKVRCYYDPRAEMVICQTCHRVHRAGTNYCATCHSSSFSSPSK